MIETLLKRFHNHDRQALSRLLTLVARGEHLQTIQSALLCDARPARVVAVTGNSGVGKSTFIGKSIEHLRNKGKSVAVLACDPQDCNCKISQRPQLPYEFPHYTTTPVIRHAHPLYTPAPVIRQATSPTRKMGLPVGQDLHYRMILFSKSVF